MPVTIATVKAHIINKVGELDPATLDPAATGLLSANVDFLWELHEPKATIRGSLQPLYVERDCIKYAIAKLRVLVDTNAGQDLQMRASQKVTALERMLMDVNAEIASELASVGRRAAAIEQIVQTSPQMPPQTRPTTIDPNDPYYGGSPFFPVRSIR